MFMRLADYQVQWRIALYGTLPQLLRSSAMDALSLPPEYLWRVQQHVLRVGVSDYAEVC